MLASFLDRSATWGIPNHNSLCLAALNQKCANYEHRGGWSTEISSSPKLIGSWGYNSSSRYNSTRSQIVSYLETYSLNTKLELWEPVISMSLATALPVASLAMLLLHPTVRWAKTLVFRRLLRNAVARAGRRRNSRWWYRRIITRKPDSSIVDGICALSFLDDPLLPNWYIATRLNCKNFC